MRARFSARFAELCDTAAIQVRKMDPVSNGLAQIASMKVPPGKWEEPFGLLVFDAGVYFWDLEVIQTALKNSRYLAEEYKKDPDLAFAIALGHLPGELVFLNKLGDRGQIPLERRGGSATYGPQSASAARKEEARAAAIDKAYKSQPWAPKPDVDPLANAKITGREDGVVVISV